MEGLEDEYRALVLERDNIVVRAAKGESVTVKPRSGNVTYGFEISASHVVIDGISLSGFSSVGIALGDSTGTQRDVVLKNLKVTMSQPEDGIVMYTDFTGSGQIASDGLLINNVTVTGAGLGISCNAGPCNNWKLENVTVTNSSQGGGSGADAIAVENGDNFVFFGGDVSGADADGIEDGALDQHVDGGVRDLAVGSAHDTGNCDWPPGIGDDQAFGRQLAFGLVD